jgi:thiamine biosynthesis protein ThiI
MRVEAVNALVVHYHEIGLKGRNRQFFEEALTRNLRRALRGTGYRRVRRALGRVVVDLEADALDEEAARRAARVFGVAYVGLGRKVPQTIDAMKDAALKLMVAEPFESFAVRARRSYPVIELKSREINTEVGQWIKDATGARVDLDHPDATAHIEMFGRTCIVYRRRFEGPGGLPVGVSGKMLALVSGGIDSPVAAWRMARRGVDVEIVHFHGQPYTDPSSMRQVADIAKVLTRHLLQVVVHFVPLGDAQREIVVQAPAPLRLVLYRRAMMRIAAALASERDAIALVTGDSLGQVASQTVENLITVDAAVPGDRVFRPLIGMDKSEIVNCAIAIGTYEVSTRPYQDCCVLFEPRRPATRARPADAAEVEEAMDLDALVGKALVDVDTRRFELAAPRDAPINPR